MYRSLVTADPNTVCPMDREDGIHDWIVNHPEYQVFNTLVDNGEYAGYEIMRGNVKVGEIYSPYTYAYTALFFAPDDHRYGLMTENFPGNHPAIEAFNALLYHDNAWGRSGEYNTGDLVWVDINNYRFIKKVVGHNFNGDVDIVVHSLGLSWTKPFNVHWDDDKRVYVQS